MSIHNFVFICSVIIGVPVAVYLLVKYKSMLFPPEKGPNPLGYLGLFTFPVILVAMVLELGADILVIKFYIMFMFLLLLDNTFMTRGNIYSTIKTRRPVRKCP